MSNRWLPRHRAVRARRDEGAVLILVLALIVIASLIVLPLLMYAVAVLRANQVVSERTERVEAAKAGFRYAMAEPQELFADCNPDVAGLNFGPTLSSPQLNVPTTTTCYLLEQRAAAEEEALPYSVATTYAGVAPPSGPGVIEPVYPNSGHANPNTWFGDSSSTFLPDSVWLPNLPVHGVNLRAAAGADMPDGYALNGYSKCKVYFPGTYKTALTIGGPTYFTSGVYYFEQPVTIVGGADVVGGSGTHVGCSDDQWSAFYATGAPATHNIKGLGVTFVFGAEGRLIVDNSKSVNSSTGVVQDVPGPVKLRMNQRYVAPNDTGGAPSAKVSIMTVNGDLDPVLAESNLADAGRDLELPGSPAPARLVVPLSEVDSVNVRPATHDSYRPSVHTPKPREPFEPEHVIGTPFNGAIVVSWQPPESDGGLPITKYVVSSPELATATCETTGATTCAVRGLTNGTPYRFQVVAWNDKGDSEPSDLSAQIRPANGSSLTAPVAPPNVRIDAGDPPVVGQSRYQDAMVVRWDPQSSPTLAPIREYNVILTDLSTNLTQSCRTIPIIGDASEMTCTFTGLTAPDPDVLPTPYQPQYKVDVTAGNVVGASPTSTLTPLTLTPPDELDPAAHAYVSPIVPLHPPFRPPPVVDFELKDPAHPVEIVVPGYVAVPQGVVAVGATGTGASASIALDGGVLAAWVDLGDVLPHEFSLGLTNPKTQRVIRVRTVVDGTNVSSDAVVQINETGGWAVNSWVVQ